MSETTSSATATADTPAVKTDPHPTPPAGTPTIDPAVARRPPPPIEFHALDRYHAATYVRDYLRGIDDGVRARLLQALAALTRSGPVHVAIPAPALPAGTPATDPSIQPADGAFRVRPFQFVHV